MSLDRGSIQVYTGNGKGKTTASIGLGIRAAGCGLKVLMVQFMKGRRYSEIDCLERIPNFKVIQSGRDEFVSKTNPEQIDIDLAREGFEIARREIGSGEWDLVILDEINVAMDFALIPVDDVVELVRGKPECMEIILTGRYAPDRIIDLADLVTEMREVKHYYNSGIQARKGIEY